MGQRGGGRGGSGLASCEPRGIANYKTTWSGSLCGVWEPYGVLEQHREGFWMKNQGDEITICPPIWGFGLFDGYPPAPRRCADAGGGVGEYGYPGLAQGVGTLDPIISTSPSPKATPIDTHLNKTWSLGSNATPPPSNHSLFLETAPVTTGGHSAHLLPLTPELGQFSIVRSRQCCRAPRPASPCSLAPWCSQGPGQPAILSSSEAPLLSGFPRQDCERLTSGIGAESPPRGRGATGAAVNEKATGGWVVDVYLDSLTC